MNIERLQAHLLETVSGIISDDTTKTALMEAFGKIDWNSFVVVSVAEAVSPAVSATVARSASPTSPSTSSTASRGATNYHVFLKYKKTHDTSYTYDSAREQWAGKTPQEKKVWTEDVEKALARKSKDKVSSSSSRSASISTSPKKIRVYDQYVKYWSARNKLEENGKTLKDIQAQWKEKTKPEKDAWSPDAEKVEKKQEVEKVDESENEIEDESEEADDE